MAKGVSVEEFNNIKMLITQGISYGQIARITSRSDSTINEINKYDIYEGYKQAVKNRFDKAFNDPRKEKNLKKPTINISKLTEEKFNLIKQIQPKFTRGETAKILKISEVTVGGVRNSGTYGDYVKWSSDRYQKYKKPVLTTMAPITKVTVDPLPSGDNPGHKELISAINNLTETLVSIETYFKQMTPLEKEGLMDRLFRSR